MLNTMLNRYGRNQGTEGQRSDYLESARRMSKLKPAPDVPAAPGLSSRISPGTVPMKKGLR